MKKVIHIIPIVMFVLFAIHSSAQAGFSISIAGKNVNLANPGELYSGDRINYKDNINAKNNNEINNNTIGANDFNINMSKPLTTEADVKKQAEKSCIILGINNQKHEDENIIRAKCHMLNMNPSPSLPELKPILKNNTDNENSLKKYKPHFEIGEIKVQETKKTMETQREKEEDIDVKSLNGDRSCDITRDLKVMLSPKCLEKTESKAQQNVGNGNYKDILNKNNEASKDMTEEQNDNSKYLCHIEFKEKMHHGFVQGYTSSSNQCIHSALLLNGVKKAEIFDHMGYIVKRYINKRN